MYNWTLFQTLVFIVVPFFFMLALAVEDEDDDDNGPGTMLPVVYPNAP